MRILLDECVPRRLKRELSGHDVRTVPEMGWSGKKNGELLQLMQGIVHRSRLTRSFAGGRMDLDLIRQRWQTLGVPVGDGLSSEAIRAFERHYRVRLPEEFQRFYRYMDGMEYGSTDEALYCFWPLSQVGPVPEKLAGFRGIPDYGGIDSALPEADSYFVFADHSIWLHVYAIRLSAEPDSPAPIVWIADGQTWAPLAASFREFLERYAADPWSVLAP